ncbi:MAG: hypothetical protein RI894_50, partial [Bacteroidota bacterium]
TDYIDRTLNGPSDDDYGSYTKINYGKASNTYNWRAPYTANKASYDRGLNANTMDDKATYIYGQKEIWNISTIESKHQVALFYYGDRTDLVGVAGENGGLAPATDPNQKLKRLEKIELYSKENFNLGAAARIPIKTVYFEYDYSLCQGIDNTSSTTTGAKGKLTLKRVYFAYGKSNKAKMNPYTFTYNLSNPAYNPKAYDRWGTYKPNPLTGTGSENAFNGVSNADFPYTKQNNLPSDKTDNDGYAAAWNLSAIQLPSGGTINVEYEAADYAYVQDKQAMEMVPIFSIEETPGTPTAGHNELYNNNSPIGNYNARNIIYFDIPATRRPTNWATMTATDKRNWLQTAYIKDLTNGGYLYFKCLTKLSPTGKHDYITGFSEVSDYGVTGDRGFVKLKPINIADRKYDTGISAGVNPISKAAWNFTRVNYPDIAFLQPSGPVTAATFNLNNADDVASVISNGGNGIAATVVSVVKAIASAFIQVSDLVTGVNLRLQTQAIGQSVALDKSWIRLYSPDGKKVGGGYRVKSVKISDGWDAMATATNAPATANTYGQLYDYTTLRDGKTISSGVTAYEPLLGGDESPFYQPIIGHYNTNSFEAKSQLTVADELLAGQIGESYFPAPNIVYSKVTVTSLKPDASTPVTRHGTGRIVHEYYTAKDFPVIVKQTGLDEQSRPIPNNSGIAVIFNLFKMVNLDYMTASQGYSIETNNMHGQAKSQAIFDENGDQISSVTYTYQTKPNGQLDNTVKVVNALGAINNAQLGVEIQMVADEQESRNKSTLAGIHGNMDSFLWPFPPIPIPLPAFLPFFSMSDTRFRAVTTAKQINRIGILKSTKVVDKGSTVSTDNIAYDEETGTLLVTKVNNDFEDAVYKMNYPAYWRYKGMGLAYQNIGANQTFANMVTAVQPGDEILVTTAGAAVKHVWVTSKVGTTSFTMIDQNGAAVPYTAAMTGKIVRSFYRNLGSMPMGEVVLKTNPVAGATLATLLNSNAVLNASATEFADRWHTFPVAQYEPCGNIDFGVIKNISTGFNNATNSLIPSSITSLDDEWRLQSYPTGAVATPAGAYLPPNGNGGLATVNMYATWIAGTPNATWLKPNTEAECTYTYFYCFTVPSGGTAVLNVSKVAADNHIGVFLSGPNNTSTTVYVNDPTQNCSQFSQLYTVNNTLTLGAGNYCLRAEVDNYGNNCPCPISIAPRQSNNKAASVSDSLKTGAANRVMIGNPTGFLLEGTLKINSTSNLPAQYNQVVGNDMNPYQNGIKGNWRPRKTYTFLDERVGTNVSTAARPRSQGVLTQFTPFWQKTGSQWLAVPGVKWQWTEEATQITPDGLALESKDPLGRYNAELLGYDNKIVKATVSNSRRREALYDGFEDYKGGTVPPANTLAADLTSHLLISNNTSCDLGSAWNLSTARSHTGTTSLKVSGNIQINLNRMPDDFENAPTTGSEDYVRSLSEVNNAGYTLDKRDCIMPYAPRTSAHKVVVSAWVYGAGSMGITDVNAGCDPTIAGPFTTGILPSGVAIEGWKRIYKVVDVPAGAKLYVNLNGDNNTYFDDIRIMPYDANMKSYVYDQVDYKLRAELDANNYATFYEYDQSGALTRVKRETERGVMTVKESRSSLTK